MDDRFQGFQSWTTNPVELGLQEHTFPPNRRMEPQGLDDIQRWVVGAGGAAVLFYGLRQEGVGRWPLALLGGALLYQGISGQNLFDHVPGVERMPVMQQLTSAPTDLRIRKTLTINRPAAELYSYWRNLENLPTFMQHVQSVKEVDGKRSHWVVRVIPNMELEWDAEITVDRPDEMIGWETVPEAMLQNRGYVKFIPTERGTEVSVSIEYDPPGAALGRFAGGSLKFIAEQQIKEEVRNFKRLMETGELPTTEGQPAARREAWRQNEEARARQSAFQPEMQGEKGV